jgi:hypothetical protein
LLRYLIRWMMCLGCIVYCNERDVFAADPWTYGLGYLSLDEFVDSITEDKAVKTVYLTQSNKSIKLESANPIKQISSQDLSEEGYLTAVQDDDVSSMHDIALRLLVKHDAMIDSPEKHQLMVLLRSFGPDLVDLTIYKFQRDYVILWQAYVFYMKTVHHASDPFFISYSQKAFNLADIHEDEIRAMFVTELFLDRFTTDFGGFIARQIIDSELKQAVDPRFLQSVQCFFDNQTRIAPPPYYDAVQTLQKAPPAYHPTE